MVKSTADLPQDPGSIPAPACQLIPVCNSVSSASDTLTQRHMQAKQENVHKIKIFNNLIIAAAVLPQESYVIAHQDTQLLLI